VSGPIPRSALVGRSAYFLLDLTYAGQTYRLSTAFLDVEDAAAGETYAYVGALDGVEWESVLDLFGESGEVSIPFEIVLQGVDVAELVEAGHDLATARAVLSRWVEGTDYADRQVLLSGVVTDPTYGAEGEPIAFSVTTVPPRTGSTFPDANAVVSHETFTSAPATHAGRVYPTVIGRPGVQGTGFRGIVSDWIGSPALTIASSGGDATFLLISDGEVEATTVFVSDGSGGGASPFDFGAGAVAVSTDTDDRGRTVSVCAAPSGIAHEETRNLGVSWSGDGGGILRDDRSGALELAGEVLTWFLRRQSAPVDYGRCAAAEPLLTGVRIACYIDEVVDVLDWVRANLLPVLPVSLVAGPDGMYPLVWRYDADAVESIDVQALDAERIGAVEYSDTDDIANEITLHYAYDAATGDYRRSQTVTGDEVVYADGAGTSFMTHASRVSFTRYGRRGRTVETDVICDDASAGAVLSWMVAAFALPFRRLRYVMDARAMFLELGAVVALTDTDLHLDGKRCMVVGLRDAGDGRLELTLRTLEDPARR
jgi:hypothetical protein